MPFSAVSLSPQSFTPPGTHPMVFAFGNQSNVMPAFPFPKVFNWTYLEFIHTIAYVQQCDKAGCRGPFLFSPKLFLNALEPTLAGWMYGLAKHVVHAYTASDGKQVVGYPEGPIVEAEWTVTGPFRKPSAFAHFPPFAAIMGKQLIGVQRLTNSFECSNFDWGLEKAAVIAPAKGRAKMHPKYGSPYEDGAALPFDGLDASPLGSFVINTRWTMSAPMACAQAAPILPPPPKPASKRRVAVLGGGLGAMTAAWYLAQSSDVTVDVYTMGHRLGGKTASGRNVTAGFGLRSQEHGLHMMLGFYNNAFELFKSIAKTDPRFASVKAWLDWALVRSPNIVGLAQPYGTRWGEDETVPNAAFAGIDVPFGGLPGAMPGAHHALPSPLELLERVLSFVYRHFEPDATARAQHAKGAGPAAYPPEVDEGLQRLLATPSAAAAASLALDRAKTLARRAATDAARGPRRGPRCHPASSSSSSSSSSVGEEEEGRSECAELASIRDALAPLHRAIHDAIDTQQAQAQQAAARAPVPPHAKTLVLSLLAALDWLVAVAHGMLAHDGRVLRLGFGAIDDANVEDYVVTYGCKPASTKNVLSESGHDLIFGYLRGNTSLPTCAAGVSIQGILNMMLNAHGPLLWKFRSGGTADILFAPLYKSLKRLGVRFHFFHKLRAAYGNATSASSPPAAAASAAAAAAATAAATPPSAPTITRLEFDVQATVRAGAAAYDPLLPDGTWPQDPRWDQLSEGKEMEARGVDVDENAYYSDWTAPSTVTLTHGTAGQGGGGDFDEIVLGIPVSALPYVGGNLPSTSPRWRAMVEGGGSVATQALQLWVSKSVEELGVKPFPTDPHPPSGVSLTSFAHPFSTWSDMSHLLPYEGWANASVPAPPKSLAYFIGVLPDERRQGFPPLSDHAYPARMRQVVKRNAVGYLERRLPFLWPALDASAGGVAPLLVGGDGKRKFDDVEAALETQYFRANVDPSARYVIPMPGAINGTRLHPAARTFGNMLLAGDWTLNGVNAGCAESAITSGMLASREVVGEPRDHVFTDYFLQAGREVRE